MSETALAILFQVYAFIFGAVFGSFLNVAIHRLPRSRAMAEENLACPHCGEELKSVPCPHCGGELAEDADSPLPEPSPSVGSRRSRCPKCGEQIAWYDNIPIFSFFILRGRCRHCKVPISWRYPFVEFLSGLFALACLLKFGLTPAAGIYYALTAALLVICYIDIDFQRIPMVITLPGVLVGFLVSPYLQGMGFKNSLIGLLVGAGGLYLIRQTYWLVRRVEGMGGGDVDLLAMLGAFLGWPGVLVSLCAGSVAGMVVGVVLMAVKKQGGKLKVPFGPFLVLGALVYIFFREPLVQWYWNYMFMVNAPV